MNGTYRNYDDNFKQMIVNHYVSGQTINELVKEFNVSKQAISSWISKYKAESNIPSNTSIVDEKHRQIQKLKAEIQQLKADNMILKKALLVFMR